MGYKTQRIGYPGILVYPGEIRWLRKISIWEQQLCFMQAVGFLQYQQSDHTVLLLLALNKTEAAKNSNVLFWSLKCDNS